MKLRILLAPVVVLLVAGCKDAAVYSQESFAADSPFKLKVASKVDAACESARRALLGQGYLIEDAGAEKVKARKAYKAGNDLNNLIEMNVVCVGERRGSTLYATGVLSTYDLKKSGSSASVGVSAVGSISLPFGQSADSLVKIGEETIDDAEFYRRFFAAVEHTLGEIESGEEPTETPPPAPLPEPTMNRPAAAESALPLPAPVQPATGSPVVPETLTAPAGAPVAPASGTAPVPVAGAVAQPAPAPEAIIGPATAPSTPVQDAPATPVNAPAAVITEPAAAAATPASGPAPTRPDAPTLEVSTPAPATPSVQTAPSSAPAAEPAPAEDPTSIFE